MKSGFGLYIWKSGNFYKGEFFNDKREGYGEMYWTNGTYYKGAWKEGVQNGEGELVNIFKLKKVLTLNRNFLRDLYEEQINIRTRIENEINLLNSKIPQTLGTKSLSCKVKSPQSQIKVKFT